MFKHILLASLVLTATASWADDSAATRPLFVRGEMNNWEAPKDAQLAETAPNMLVAKVALKASHGAYKFKVADEKWKGDTTYGQFDPTAKVTLDAPVQVKAGWQWSDMHFTPDADGTYSFTLDRTDAKKMTITVKKAG